ncbi:MAG: hypothetical protein ACYCYI_11465 [Saccharofermentanales bacterium]
MSLFGIFDFISDIFDAERLCRYAGIWFSTAETVFDKTATGEAIVDVIAADMPVEDGFPEFIGILYSEDIFSLISIEEITAFKLTVELDETGESVIFILQAAHVKNKIIINDEHKNFFISYSPAVFIYKIITNKNALMTLLIKHFLSAMQFLLSVVQFSQERADIFK